ncbi:MAG: energy-coupling factor transporter transmembrane protein EcfT [Bacteroides sp.]|nr:energy-coupling factor transporter transmembrane protein EcfT [Bacteroides sp.]
MKRLEQAIEGLRRMEQTADGSSWLQRTDARAKLAVTVAYLFCLLSIPLTKPDGVLLMLTYPLACSTLAGISYGRLLRRSLVVLPLLLGVALFNPLTDRQVVFRVMEVEVNRGWITLSALLLRGLLSMQALLLLVESTGFYALCHAFRRLGMPSVFSTQLFFLYRYLGLLLQEALAMSRAWASRGYGRKNYPLGMWGVFVGRLLLRAVERAGRIHRAMLARGFTGELPLLLPHARWQWRDTLFLLFWTVLNWHLSRLTV